MALSEARLEPFLLNSPRHLQPGLRDFIPLGTTTAFGPYANSFFVFNHYAFGGVSATRAFALWCSTSASGRTRRVPPPRGSPPRCPSRAFPSSSASSSLFFFYEAFPHSEVRRLWALLWSGPLSLLLWVCVLFCGPLFATGTSSGADGRVSRLRSSSPTAIVFSIPSFLCTCSAESQCTRAVGRVSRPRSSTWTYSFLYSFHFIGHVYADRVQLLFVFPFKFSSGVVMRSTCVVCLVSVSQLSWSGQAGRLPSCVQVIGLL